MPTILQGLTLVATLATSGASAAGQALDRYGGRTHPASDAVQDVAAAEPPSPPVDPASGVRFYALHRDYGLTPDLKPAQAPLAVGAPATEVTAPAPVDATPPPATAPARPATPPSDSRAER